jgi:hypothetical protein
MMKIRPKQMIFNMSMARLDHRVIKSIRSIGKQPINRFGKTAIQVDLSWVGGQIMNRLEIGEKRRG